MTQLIGNSVCTALNSFRYSFQGQEKDDEVVGASNSINYNFRILDTRIGRWSSLDPKIKSWESPYVSMGNSPILFLDPHGDDIINGVTKVVQEKEAAVLKSQESYDALVSSHVGELKNGDIRKYKKESGLNYALDELEKWQNIKTDVDQMISTFATVMPEEFEFLSNLTDQSGNCIDVVIDYQDRASPLGDTNPASTQMNAGATTVMNPDGDVYVVWNGSFHGNIISVTLWASGINTKFLANEFGDIDYFFRKVKPNDRESIET
ncbi:MAG: hypothetical protein JNJ99_05525, partial [Crocinitomicaceae bacterium]|nr:hypothetical protein [Crocinitomicaceae bacterium]